MLASATRTVLRRVRHVQSPALPRHGPVVPALALVPLTLARRSFGTEKGWRALEEEGEYHYEYAGDAVSAWRAARKVLRRQGEEPSSLSLRDLFLKSDGSMKALREPAPKFPGRWYTLEAPEGAMAAADAAAATAKGAPPECVLLGWNFSTKKQLAKYADWYFKRGFSRVHVFRPTLFHTYAFHQPIGVGKRVLGKMAEIKATAEEAGTERPKVVFQIFSGSAYLYLRSLHMMEALPEYAPLKECIDGVVFDSTPIEDTATNGANAVISASKWVPRLIKPALYSVFWSYWHFSSILFPFDGELKGRFWEMLGERAPVRAPVLFLYSKDDLIAPWSFIEMQMDKMRRGGIDVASHCFPARSRKRTWPPHVTHFKQYNQTYTEVMEAFLERQSFPIACAPADSPDKASHPELVQRKSKTSGGEGSSSHNTAAAVAAQSN